MQADLKVLIAELRDHVRYRYMPAACRVAMVRAADALEAVQNTTPGSGEGWRDIATAPKDGTHVVIFAPKTPGGAKRKSRRGCPATVAHFEQGWGWLSTPGDYQVKPTHWQPLPEPPK